METQADDINYILKNKFKESNLKSSILAKGNFIYYHYGMHGVSDQGWGCGYRTVQTICSWIKKSMSQSNVKWKSPDVPTIEEIQQLLVNCGDKKNDFIGSKQWIGTFEACIVLDTLFEVPCKIVHFKADSIDGLAFLLEDHFQTFGSPVMIGGDLDCSSKGVFGIGKDKDEQDCYLLVDPHYHGNEQILQTIIDDGWMSWRPLSSLSESSFYNVCLPQIEAMDL